MANDETRPFKNTQVTVTMPFVLWQSILDALDNYCDEGPEGEGWKSPNLSRAQAALEAAING